MMEFEEVTPFRLVRSSGVSGARNPAVYLLVCDEPSVLEIEEDLSTEAEAQLGTVIRISTASEVLRDGTFSSSHRAFASKRHRPRLPSRRSGDLPRPLSSPLRPGEPMQNT